MREAFSASLVRLAKADSRLLLLTGDHGYSLFDEFRRECPAQYINAGIAEQNMVGMAAGLARTGFRPFVYGLSAFIPLRVVEQIKLDIAHDNLPVVLIGDGAGFVYSHLGTSHQSTEDIACTRAIPGLNIYSPSDRFEIGACMDAAYEAKAPAYFRIGKADRGDVHSSTLTLTEDGSLLQVQFGKKSEFAFIATGSMVRTAIDISKNQFDDATVFSAPLIKPLHKPQVIDICANYKAVIVLEEHSVIGGLGSAIAEIASEYAPIRILRIGVQDRFSHLCGSYEYLLREHGLDYEAIIKRVRNFLTIN